MRCLAARARAPPSGTRRALIVNRRHWIPPVVLGAGQLAHGASWILMLVLALHRPFALGSPALGWLHLVALGWLTTTALAILVRVIPGFTDATGRASASRAARSSLSRLQLSRSSSPFGPARSPYCRGPVRSSCLLLHAISFRRPARDRICWSENRGGSCARLAHHAGISLDNSRHRCGSGMDVGWIGPTRPRSYRRDRRFMVRSALSAG
jgi:hypothetical protein